MFVRVVTPPASEPVTLAEAKLFLREMNSDQDALITSLISAVRRYGESYTRRAIMPQTLELMMETFPSSFATIDLPRPPLVAISSVKYKDISGVDQTVDSSLYQVDTYSEPGRIAPVFGKYWFPTRFDLNAVRIQYTAGYADAAHVPEEFKTWMKARIAQLYEFREAVSEGMMIQEIPYNYVDGVLDTMRCNYFK
jgi:uncharacterized phiE125 gp8 family phage protein